MTDIVERARAALKGITDGPWDVRDGFVYPLAIRCGLGAIRTQDGEFIAQARTLVPELVAEVERLRNDSDWFAKRLQDELDPGGGDEWDADDVVQIVRDLESEVERLRNDLDFYREWSNDLTQHIPESFDDDIAQEAIISNWAKQASEALDRVRDIGERLSRLDGQRVAHWNSALGREILAALGVFSDRP